MVRCSLCVAVVLVLVLGAALLSAQAAPQGPQELRTGSGPRPDAHADPALITVPTREPTHPQCPAGKVPDRKGFCRTRFT